MVVTGGTIALMITLKLVPCYGTFFQNIQNNYTMEIPDKLKFEYLLSLDNHIDTEGIDNRKETMKKIFEITKKIADLGFGEKDIHGITTDEEVYIKYEQWRKDNDI